MSFGASNTTKAGNNNLGGISNLALNTEFPQFNKAGGENVGSGTGVVTQGLNTMQPGINLFNTLLQGNRANTTAALQPDINRIQGDNANTLTAINTLMPRGGARSGALFNQALQPTAQIQNLFNGARTGAANALPQIGQAQAGIGLGQANLGANLFGLGNQSLNTGVGANVPLIQSGMATQARSDAINSAIGKSLFGLATLPFGGGGGSLVGKL